MYRLYSCNEKYVYYQTVMDKLIEICFPSKVVTRHTGDKPWITDVYRLLIRKRQRAHMRGAYLKPGLCEIKLTEQQRN